MSAIQDHREVNDLNNRWLRAFLKEEHRQMEEAVRLDFIKASMPHENFFGVFFEVMRQYAETLENSAKYVVERYRGENENDRAALQMVIDKGQTVGYLFGVRSEETEHDPETLGAALHDEQLTIMLGRFVRLWTAAKDFRDGKITQKVFYARVFP